MRRAFPFGSLSGRFCELVADLEQNVELARPGLDLGRHVVGLLGGGFHAVHHLDQHEDDEGDDQEVDALP